jgi:hypothetical protein
MQASILYEKLSLDLNGPTTAVSDQAKILEKLKKYIGACAHAFYNSANGLVPKPVLLDFPMDGDRLKKLLEGLPSGGEKRTLFRREDNTGKKVFWRDILRLYGESEGGTTEIIDALNRYAVVFKDAVRQEGLFEIFWKKLKDKLYSLPLKQIKTLLPNECAVYQRERLRSVETSRRNFDERLLGSLVLSSSDPDRFGDRLCEDLQGGYDAIIQNEILAVFSEKLNEYVEKEFLVDVRCAETRITQGIYELKPIIPAFLNGPTFEPTTPINWNIDVLDEMDAFYPIGAQVWSVEETKELLNGLKGDEFHVLIDELKPYIYLLISAEQKEFFQDVHGTPTVRVGSVEPILKGIHGLDSSIFGVLTLIPIPELLEV